MSVVPTFGPGWRETALAGLALVRRTKFEGYGDSLPRACRELVASLLRACCERSVATQRGNPAWQPSVATQRDNPA
jgi:hypothetical protein